MEHKNISLIDVIESFLTGICCLVGGDQLYLFISQTDTDAYNQYHYMYAGSILTLTIAFILYDEYNEDFMNAVQLVYTILLIFIVLILYFRIRSVTIVTLCTIFLSIILTIFVLLCCISYSIDRVLLLTFILGLFGSRLLPTLYWLFIDNKYPNIDIQHYDFTLNIYFVRFIICILSIIIKIVNNNFGLSINIITYIKYDLLIIKTFGFVNLINSFRNLVLIILPTLSFFCSTLIYINLTPIVPSSHFNYSTNIKSQLSMIDMPFHLFGIIMGIIYPASITPNSLSFYLVTFLLWALYIFSYYGDTFSNFKIYIAPIISPLVLGYLCSYNLGVTANITILKTCKYEEYFNPCCGDKFILECYCIHHKTIEMIYHKDGNKLLCSKLYEGNNNVKYSPTGSCAILILYTQDGQNIGDCKNIKCCPEDCKQRCTGSGNCKCLKLLGVYKLDTITTNSCDMCQLTVRLEAKKICSHSCPSTGGSCSCGGTSSNCCCCLAVGCCTTGGGCDNEKCCCIRMCCCNGSSCTSCQCKSKSSNEVRIFFGYYETDKCCIKEIKPNDKPQFQGSLGKQNEFYIRNIYISDCCHIDLQVDLHCYMKNSFYRLTGVNYYMKSLMITSIIFVRDDGKCCTTTTSSQCCCCIDIPLVRLFVKYEPYPIHNDQSRHDLNKYKLNIICYGKCNSKCGCCKNGKCCCCNAFNLYTSVKSSFYKTMEPVRIKFISIFMILFVGVLIITIIIVPNDEDKMLKYYDFNPISFDKITKSANKYKLNSDESISVRLNNNSKESNDKSNNKINLNKTEDLKIILKLFEQILDEKSYNKLNKYINKKSDKYINKYNNNISKNDIIWSYCIGLMYSYVIEMFLNIQEYFIRWEFVWQKEYLNYQKSINTTFSNITHKSKCGISMISELNINEKIPYCVTRNRTNSLYNTYNELNRYININENEFKYNQEIPSDKNYRLKYFIEKWDHRIYTTIYLVNNKLNILNWDLFIDSYQYIQKWFNTFHPYLEQASKIVRTP